MCIRDRTGTGRVRHRHAGRRIAAAGGGSVRPGQNVLRRRDLGFRTDVAPGAGVPFRPRRGAARTAFRPDARARPGRLVGPRAPGNPPVPPARCVGIVCRVAPLPTYGVAPANRFILAAPFSAGPPTAPAGTVSDVTEADGSSTSLTFTTSGSGSATSRGAAAAVTSTLLTIDLYRPNGGVGPVTFAAAWSITTASGTVTGTAEGEALFVDCGWHLRGRSLFSGGTWNIASGMGGFSADLAVNTMGTSADDAITWQVDGVVAG